MELRPYQTNLVDAVRDAMRVHRSVLMQSPTGSGKTAMLVYMMRRAAERGKRAFFLVHQRELLMQTSRAMWDQKLEHGLIAPGKRISKLPVQLASVQTLVRRLDRYQEPDLIVIDECHRAAAATYMRVLEAYPNARVIGLTATPARTDGKGLDDLFDTIVEGPTIRQLINAGYLSDYALVAPPPKADISGVKTRGGDYDSKELEAELDKPTITGDAVAAYKKHANGRRCVVMCVSIKHAEHVAESYRAAGVPAEVIKGEMLNTDRVEVLERFTSGETLVLCNVELMVVGVDIPAIGAIQWLRPTQSLIVFLQGNGRGLRPHATKDKLVILDQVENWTRHGLPCEDREWTLEGRKGRKRKKDEEPDLHVQQCPECYHVFRKGPELCPSCGEELPKKGRAELEVVEGDLQEIDIDQIKKRRKQEQGQARSLKDLVELGIRRGMNRPAQWAAITLAARQRRKPRPDEFVEAKRLMMEVRG